MKRCLILTGGRLDPAFAGSFLQTEEFNRVIAVDGGLKGAKELGRIQFGHGRIYGSQVLSLMGIFQLLQSSFNRSLLVGIILSQRDRQKLS